jgi:cytochrome c oxidase subunit 2
MPVVLVALEEQDYLNWVEEQKAAAKAEESLSGQTFELAELVSKGEDVYNRNCASCHQANGEGLPGIFPAIKGSPVATGDISEHVNIVMKGSPGTAMQAFAGQLSDVDMAAVITYQRNAWGNDVGDSLQPAQVANQR